MVTIETATVQHIPQLCILLDDLFSQEADFTPDRARQERGLRLIIDDPKVGRILIARDGTQVIGMVNLLATVSTAEGGPVLWLEDMVVHRDRRGAGIGLALIEAAIEQARKDGFLRITLLTDENNASAQWFYGRAGFRRSAMVPMRRSIP